ncbi:hypothetical protein EV138_3367 [Kribbella voronezhensis]|jgi:hypothetical protein|uniref:Uncharacterized protein n=1 Tax=Kribbella voronezhensis TaxID=2512212 RepID=A0A4R7TCH3_9ACTN|nr:hypothetical protein [Kribbella voronezhensis]TDU89791.1 hypothetical protein EV138_3367 [Kribbella voronezhensis]
MNWTDYAGLAGLAAAAVLAAWMLLGAGNTTPHRGDHRHAAGHPALTTRSGRHRAPAVRILQRIRLR